MIFGASSVSRSRLPRYPRSIFSAAASLHLPGAQLSLKVAEAVETGADRVHTWASGANVEVAEPAPARARRAKRA